MSNNAMINYPLPQNEPIKSYLEGSPERIALEAELERQSSTIVEIPLIIGGKEVRTGNMGEVVMPHDHGHVLARYHKAGEKEIKMAVEAAMEAHKIWSDTSWHTRSSIMLKVAELLSTKYRAIISAATMLGQSKNIYQSEIDSVCETIDFLRYNVTYAAQIYGSQPKSTTNNLNSVEYRPLEGFVFAISPFNFTAIASNLNLAPVMVGNTTIWKTATTAILSNYYLMQIFMEAGLPAGVVNFLCGSGAMMGGIILDSPDFAGIHFTGSTGTFNHLWQSVGQNLSKYKSYPRLVGETGGKDFMFIHPTADAQEVATAAFCGAFEYQGQKCSAASRMYIPKSLWVEVLKLMKGYAAEVKMGDTRDSQNFINAVIDEASFDNIVSYIEYAKQAPDAEIVIGGTYDKSKGYFIKPTVIETTNPKFKSIQEEIFGPVLTVLPYDDDKLEETIELCNTTSPYALTGAIMGRDRLALDDLAHKLRYAAGNFYINDKPTGAIVGMQPFGGGRASGTNDKAGAYLNLVRWISPRTIKETLVPAVSYKATYPYMK